MTSYCNIRNHICKMAEFDELVKLCERWEKVGRNEFLTQCRAHVATASNDGIFSGDTQELRDVLYGFIWLCLRDTIKPDVAAAALSEVAHMHGGVSSFMADIFSIIDIETSSLETKSKSETETKSERKNLLELLKKCKSFLTDGVLKERMEYETLEEIKVIQKKEAFKQKYVRLKTKLFYKQQKFNLLREESEGYSKLGVELAQVSNGQSNHEQLLESIKSLVGCFDLDPNRVLDMILEAFECSPQMDELFVPLLQNYMCEPLTLCHVLGFKFHFYKEENINTPESLHRIAALMLQHHLVSLDDLYPHLMPSDTDMIQNYKKSITEARQFARKMTIVMLSDREKEEEETEKEKKENKDEKPPDNQKLGLIEAMIKLGDWPNTQQLIDRLPNYCAVSHSPVAKALSSLVAALIDPLYKAHAMPKGAKSPVLTPPSGSKAVKVPTRFLDLGPTFKMCNYLGPYTSCQPAVVWKLVRLGKVLMTKRASSTTEKDSWEDVYRSLLSLIEGTLLPSMSMLDHNACLSEEMWSLLKLMPYNIRYCLYGRWKNSTYAVHPPLIRIKAVTTDRAKYLMKRLTKDNVKPMGRQIGKLSHVNPGILFDYVLSTIQRYDNFIGPVVDSLKYITSLSYDVLAYCVIEALANPEKERMKHDDTTLSSWIQSLASFCGTMFRKYNIELTGLLQYVTNQLKAGKSYDLLILREIIVKMAGIEVTEEMTPDQLEALAGGELLRAEGGYFSQVRNTKKSSSRLKDALLTDNLGVALCMLMSQERFSVVFKIGMGVHVKLLGQLHDQCQDTLVQLGGFLSNQLGTEDYAKHLPLLSTMVAEYHITPENAFFLSRPMCTHAINSKFDELRKQERSAHSSQKLSSQQKMQCYVNAVQAVLAPLVESVRALHVPKVWDDISQQFYCTFWTLSTYDLYIPSSSYDKELNKIRAQLNSLEENKDMVSAKRKKERERYNMIMDKLRDEEKKQVEHCSRVLTRLKSECENWFTARSTKNETITQFLQLCIFPRCCFTASDALYCAKFVLTVHQLKTQNFSTLLCYDRVFQDITYTLASCTENEASRYGRFLCEMLKTVQKWHSDKSIYEKECGNYPGFVTVLRASGTESSNKADQLDYENFRHVCHKWQYKLTKAVVSCLESKDYLQIRNTLILLTKILMYFPLVLNLSVVLEKRVDKIRADEKEKRPDLFALAMGYSGLLKSRKPHMIAEDQFHTKDTKSQGTGSSTTASKKPAAPSTSSNPGASSVDRTSSPAFNSAPEVTREGSSSSHGSRASASASNPTSSSIKKTSSSSGAHPTSSRAEQRADTKGHQDDRKEERGRGEVKGRGEDKGHKEDKGKNKDKARRKEEKTPKSEKGSLEDGRKEESHKSRSSSKEHDKTPKGSDDSKHRDHDKERQERRAPPQDHSAEKSHKSKRTSAGLETETKDEKRSSSERWQRGESITSNSSQASSGTGVTQRRVSPGKETTEREHKRRKVGQSPNAPQDKAKDGERDLHSDRDRESRRDKDKKTSEKKRDHSEGEREGAHEAKRRKDEDSAGVRKATSPSSRDEKEKQKTPKSSNRPSSSGDAAVNGERTATAKKETPKEREGSKVRKEARSEDTSSEKTSSEKTSKRDSRGEDGRKGKRDAKDEEEDRHHSSSRKRRP